MQNSEAGDRISRIMILGMSPMPFENDRKVYGTGIRTWQFVSPLLKKGHEICVCNYAIPSAYEDNFNSRFTGCYTSRAGDTTGLTFEYNILSKKDFENTGLLKEVYLKFKPDCIVGCSFYPSYYAAKLKDSSGSAVPLWADLFGHVMAEAQARAFMDGSDDCLFHYWNSEYNILTFADVFSCVSDRQSYALAGELGAVGRLNRHTSGYDFFSTIPCGMPLEEYRHTKKVIRGINGISDDDFVILWTGGYNTWTDVDTLFEGLIKAMKQDEKIRFVSTGGAIPEQDPDTYPRFLTMIENSQYRENFIMKGWIAGEDVPNYYLEANAGINIDKDIYEVRFGSKNRILDWMRAGLAVISSNVCELTEIIEREGIGYTFLPGNSEDLAKKILMISKNRQSLKAIAEKARKYGKKHFNFNITTIKLQKWVQDPVFAPDHNKPMSIIFEKEEALRNLEAIMLRQKDMIEVRDKRIAELEGLLKKNPAYRAYNYLRIAKRKFFINKKKNPS